MVASSDEDPTRPNPARPCGEPRLFIMEMVMENFKSYAGEQRVGPFHKCFSAVVGPNGSGKSNVIDAMLFVFGKRAKQMRLNKVSELIHNSTNHQNLDKARVSVHFQEIVDLDDETFQPVPGTEFVITRVAFRDNSSKYYINDRPSTFTEVGKKLRAKGVDLDNNRFLILQGEVEQISLMKPKGQNANDEGFLEYLEDIIGSNVYVERIDEMNKQLETLNEKRVSVVQRVKISQKEKDGLQGAKDQAEAHMLKEAELLKWQVKTTDLAHEEASMNAVHLKEQVSELEAKLRMERENFEVCSKEMLEAEAKFNKQMKRREEVETDLKACGEKFKKFERQDTKYREDLKHLKQKLKKLDEKISKDTAKIKEVEVETEECETAIPQLEEDIYNLNIKLNQEEKKLDQIRESSKVEVEKYRERLASVRVELEPWEKQVIECEGVIGIQSSESTLLKEKHSASQVSYKQACDNMETIKQTLLTKEEELKNLTDALQKNRMLGASGREEEQICLKDEGVLSSQEQAARQKVNELRKTVENEKSQGALLQAIIQAKESGLIEGIYGRLGDLGAIDAKYDVAISTACGGLDYIVVETTAAAQACVELLRTKGLGVATFLILDKQKELISTMSRRIQTPEGVPRLFDLIKVRDDKLRVAFYYAIGNTVVANNLDQASRIAYGPDRDFRRVVTLDGALFERSGTMSGGGGKPKGGRMGSTIIEVGVSAEAIQSAESESARLTRDLNANRERMTAAVSQYQTAEKAVAQLELEIAKTRMEVEALILQQKETTAQLGDLKTAAQPKPDELERILELDQSVSKEQAKLKTIEKSSAKLREQAKDLQEKMENAGGEKLKQLKASVDKLQKEMDQKSSAINKKKVQITTGAKSLLTLKNNIETTTTEKANGLEEKERKIAEFKDIESKAFELQGEYTKLQEIFEMQTKEVEETKKTYKDFQTQFNKRRTEEVDAQNKLVDLKRHADEKDRRVKDLMHKSKDFSEKLRKQIEQIHKEMIDAELLASAMEQPADCDLRIGNQKVELLTNQLKELSPTLDAIAEYRAKAAQYDERVRELNLVTEERDDAKRQYDELRKRRLDDFMAGFNSISLKLKEMYQMITLGGDAELELVDSLDPFAEGVVFSVRPPKKSWKNIANLSGGEKTLSSLALVFALHHYKPTPLYVMDEIDAALDFKNVSIIGHYIKDRTKNAQFVIISLRNNMFELADRLIGIYKTENCTKSITINPSSFAVKGAGS
ncbi:unnamed protein product [Calypogeia fissa]